MLDVSEEFKTVSPLRKIPVFKDEYYVIADSSAICAYIDAKYPSPSFYPKDPEALGQVLWFEEYADTALFQAIAPFYYQTILVPLYRNRKPDQNAINIAITQNLPPVADYLEKAISGKNFFVGDQFSIADAAIVSTFLNMYLAGFPLPDSKWPYLTTYLNKHFQTESFNSCRDDVLLELSKVKELSNVA